MVLVHDEAGLYEQDLDGRLGFINPLGLDVRTRGGEFLGKVKAQLGLPMGSLVAVSYPHRTLPTNRVV